MFCHLDLQLTSQLEPVKGSTLKVGVKGYLCYVLAVVFETQVQCSILQAIQAQLLFIHIMGFLNLRTLPAFPQMKSENPNDHMAFPQE